MMLWEPLEIVTFYLSLSVGHLLPQRIAFEVLIGSQPAFTCLKLTLGTPEQGVKYVQS